MKTLFVAVYNHYKRIQLRNDPEWVGVTRLDSDGMPVLDEKLEWRSLD